MRLEDLLELVFVFTITSVSQSAVNLFHIAAEVYHHLRLLDGGHLLLGLTLKTFHDSLGLLDVSSSSHLSAFHDTVFLKKVGIDIQVELITFTRDLHLLSDDTQAF